MNWIVAFTTPIFLAKSSYGVYFLFGGCLLLTVAVCVFMMPETSGRSLEDIDASFGRKIPTGIVMELRDVEEYRPFEVPGVKDDAVDIGVISSSSSSVY